MARAAVAIRAARAGCPARQGQPGAGHDGIASGGGGLASKEPVLCPVHA